MGVWETGWKISCQAKKAYLHERAQKERRDQAEARQRGISEQQTRSRNLESQAQIQQRLRQELSYYNPQGLLLDVKNSVWKVGKIVEDDKVGLQRTSYSATVLFHEYPVVTPGGNHFDRGSYSASRGRGYSAMAIGIKWIIIRRAIKSSYFGLLKT
jgi:hypothetical protein